MIVPLQIDVDPQQAVADHDQAGRELETARVTREALEKAVELVRIALGIQVDIEVYAHCADRFPAERVEAMRIMAGAIFGQPGRSYVGKGSHCWYHFGRSVADGGIAMSIHYDAPNEKPAADQATGC